MLQVQVSDTTMPKSELMFVPKTFSLKPYII